MVPIEAGLPNLVWVEGRHVGEVACPPEEYMTLSVVECMV